MQKINKLQEEKKKKRADDTFPNMRLRGGLSLRFLLVIFGWNICCTAVGGLPPPPVITLTSSTDDTLVISVVPTTYGITRHDILQVASSQVSPLKQLAITGGAADPPRSSNFLPSSCYDGIITTECATNSNGVGRWISFDFAAATLRQVKITKHSTASNHIKLTNFDMEYQDENGGWSDCPGTPYSFPVSDGQGPLTFACLTPVKAVKIKIVQRENQNPQFAEIKLDGYKGELWSMGTSTSYTLTQAGIGKTASKFYSRTCTHADGCGDFESTPGIELRAPDPPVSIIARVTATNELTVAVPAPVNDGGLPLTSYRFYVFSRFSTSTGEKVTLTGEELSTTLNSYPASRCTDGDLTNFCSNAGTNEVNAYLRVFFGSAWVKSVKIYNRPDCCQNRLGNFNLKWKDASAHWHDCPGSPYSYPTEVGPLSFDCLTSQPSVAIEVQKIGSGNHLNLAEVEVYTPELHETKDVAVASTVGLTDEAVTFADLDLATSNKDVRVAGCNAVGCGSYSTSLVLLGSPSAATDIVVSVKDTNTLTLTGKLPVHDGGYNLTQYNFYVGGAMGSKIDIAAVSQVSTASSSAKPAEMCIDGYGKTGGSSYDKGRYCATTSGPNRWWMAEFRANFVHTVKIWNRPIDRSYCNAGNGCLARLGDFDLTWKDTGDNWHTCPGSPFNYPNAVGPKSFVCQTNLKAKAIKIQQHKDDYMNMAEVEIYSTCTDDNVCLQNKPDFTSTADCASASNSAYCQPNANEAYRHAVLSCCFHTCGICSDPVQSITATTAATWTGELAGTGIGTSFPDSIYPFSCNTAGCGAFAPKLAPAVPVDPPATATVQIVDGNTLTFTATGGTNNGGAAVSEFMVKEEGTPSEVDITGCKQSSTAGYNCDKAYTGGDSHTTGGSNQWLRFDFAATFIHSVNIDVYHGMDPYHLKHFDLTWQDDSDNTWHTCVGSPYNLVSYDPTTFACPTTNGRARAIKISPTATTASIQITSIKVYARVFNDLGTVPASGGGNIMKAGYGASPKTFFLLSCNFFGCGHPLIDIATGPPNPPSTFTVVVKDANTLTIDGTAPDNNGGTPVTGYNVAWIEMDSDSPVSIISGEFSANSDAQRSWDKCTDGVITSSNYCQSTLNSNKAWDTAPDWLRLDFTATFLHSVQIQGKIESSKFSLDWFTLKWQSEDKAWHDCPGSPYYWEDETNEGPITFSCVTTQDKAISIKIQHVENTRTKMMLKEVTVYPPKFTAVSLSDSSTLSHEIQGSNYETTPQTLCAAACNALASFGCSGYICASTGIPDPPLSASVTRIDDDTMSLVISDGENDGGKAITSYNVYDSAAATNVVTIVSAVFSSGESTNVAYGDEKCYDGSKDSFGRSKLETGRQGIHLSFAGSYLHSVGIQNKYNTAGSYGADVGTFDLRYRGVDNQWYMCPGSPYTHPAVSKVVEVYSCISTMTAITVEIYQHGEGYATYAEIQIFSPVTTPVELPANKQLVKTNVGTSARSFYLNACNSFGCSNFIQSNHMSPPSIGPSVTSFAVAEMDKIEAQFEPPIDNGGASVTQMKAVLEPIFHQAGDDTLNRQQFDLPNSNNWQSTISADATDAGAEPSGLPYALTEMQACNVYGCSSVSTASFLTSPPCTTPSFEKYGVCWSVQCPAGKFRSVTTCVPMTNHPSCPAGKSYSSASATQGFAGSTADDASCTPCAAGRYNDIQAGHESCKPCVVGMYTASTQSSVCLNCPRGYYGDSENIQPQSCIGCIKGKYGRKHVEAQSALDTTAVYYYLPDAIHLRRSSAECVICPGGEWTDSPNTPECTKCAAGKYLLDDGQTIDLHDTEADCTECDVGLYSPILGLDGDCISCPAATSTGATTCGGACDPGTYKSTNDDCVFCDAGKYTPQKDLSACYACPRGWYSKGAIFSTSAVTGTNELVFATAHGLASTAKVTYHDNTHATITELTDGGTYYVLAGTAATTMKLSETSGGSAITIAASGGAVGNQIVTFESHPFNECNTCGRGKYGETTEANSESACKSCSPGRFSADVGLDGTVPSSSQNDWTVVLVSAADITASVGATVTQGSTTNGVLKTELTGTDTTSLIVQAEAGVIFLSTTAVDIGGTIIQPDAINTVTPAACIGCPAGKWSDADGQTQESLCKDCGAGRYGSATLAALSVSICKPCVAGKFSETVGKDSTGTVVYSGHTLKAHCLDCPAGFSLEDVTGKAYCLPCTPGKRQHIEGSTSCIDCETGRASADDELTSVTCKDCVPGKYQNQKGRAQCTLCAPGRYQTSTGKILKCEKCTENKYTDQAEQTSCKICDMGKYTNDKGSVICNDCVPGKYGENCKSCPIGWKRAEGEDVAQCIHCEIGEMTTGNGSTTCADCDVGQYGSAKGTCSSCAEGKFTDNKGLLLCSRCTNGQVNDKKSSCIKCAVGRRGVDVGSSGGTASFGCQDCEEGKFADDTGLDSCEVCNNGEVNDKKSACLVCRTGTYGSSAALGFGCKKCSKGQYQDEIGKDDCKSCVNGEVVAGASCNLCGLGKHGANSASETFGCMPCGPDEYQDLEGQPICKKCERGEIPNNSSTSCDKPTYPIKEDCEYRAESGEYFNDTDSERMLHTCVACPSGGYCVNETLRVVRVVREIKPKSGYWRVPWSKTNNMSLTFAKCPYANDCLGYSSETTHEGCKLGTRGPLCSICLEGYNRDVSTCNQCDNSDFVLRVSVLVGVFVILALVLWHFRRRIKTKWQKYRTLWRDLLRVFSINVTFAQINSSMTSVIEIEWPEAWQNFVRYFDFVNIDLMSLVGANCIGNFDYYNSFVIMVTMPVIVVVFAIISYTWSVAALSRKMAHMTEEEKKIKQQEAFHSLFELADADRSGEIDPSELVTLLRQLGWRINLESVLELCKKIGVKSNSKGIITIKESFFVNVMRKGTLQATLRTMQIPKTGGRKVQRSSAAHASSNNLNDSSKLVEWALRRHIVSSSLSGATQLLLLAHTPVSRKVFQYFHSRDVGGTTLLRADYNINTDSDRYKMFMPFVIVVLLGFTVALPAVLSFYLIYHRKDLYSTAVHEKIGWLYDPFVRNAEWWQIHDVLMKMVLTGLLIYIPPASRAGIAAMLCMVVIANLNYFHPHKNNILFWLTQLSFMTTGAKYVMGLLLKAGTAKNSEGAYCEQFLTMETCIGDIHCTWDGNQVCTSPLIGNILITLDVFFMVSSFLSVPIAVITMKSKFEKLHQEMNKSGGGASVHPSPGPSDERSFLPTAARKEVPLVPKHLRNGTVDTGGTMEDVDNLAHITEATSPAIELSLRQEEQQQKEEEENVPVPFEDPEINEIKQIMLRLVKTPEKMHSVFKKLDRENSHGLTQDEFHLFVKAACKKAGKTLDERVFKLLWLSIEHHKVEDHDELEEAAVEKWLFFVPKEGGSSSSSSKEEEQVAGFHHQRSRGRHGGVADIMGASAASGNHMDL